MKKEYYGHHKTFLDKADALESCDVESLDTDGMDWNGEMYYDRTTKESWWPVYENEMDDDGELIQGDVIGYIKGY